MFQNFYASLRPVHSLRAILDPDAFRPAPPSWSIALTDVRGSTEAIRQGQYRAVNMVGASSIVALLNLDRRIDLPFLFGGDGATVLIPPTLVEGARAALRATRALAREQFGLELRAGIVPVSAVQEAGYRLGVARLRLSDNYDQALFGGRGLAFAEQLLKESEESPYVVRGAPTGGADFSGLECRWKDIPSQHGEIVSLIAMALSPDLEAARASYGALLEKIGECYGEERQYRPVDTTTLDPALGGGLGIEARIRARPSGLARAAYLARSWVESLLLSLSLRAGWSVGGVDWRAYRKGIVETTDYQKYDGRLRMLLAGTPAHRACLERYLAAEASAGRLAYGLHVSDRALMTCLVLERAGKQVHFVDGADGGYTLAAAAMKEQLRGAARHGP